MKKAKTIKKFKRYTHKVSRKKNKNHLKKDWFLTVKPKEVYSLKKFLN